MNERDIRYKVQQLCAELDERAGRALRRGAATVVVGAGLAAASCSGEAVISPGGDAGVAGAGGSGGTASPYDAGQGGLGGAGEGGAIQPPYMGPDAGEGGFQPHYGAPDPADAGDDAGSYPPYMAP